MPKVPSWEIELWSYLSSGDGTYCPLCNRCQKRERDGWCPDENKEDINRFLDERECNFHSYDSIRSEAEGICRLGQLVEMLAQKYLKTAEVCCPPVSTRLVTLFDQHHRIEVRRLPLRVYHGAIWRHKDSWVIQVKDSDVSATQRFTIFHEAFHILAHSRTNPVFRKRGSIVGSFNELLADGFASCILMPRQWVKEKWTEIKDLDGMAEIFAVPKSAMCIRLKWLGLI